MENKVTWVLCIVFWKGGEDNVPHISDDKVSLVDRLYYRLHLVATGFVRCLMRFFEG